jgi:hypothetical protein
MMQQRHLNPYDSSSMPTGTDHSDGGVEMDGFERMVERVVQAGVIETDFPDDGRTAGPARVELLEALDDPERTLDFDPSECVACISRGNVRYHKGDPECEADYRTAFVLDARLAASEIVLRLQGDMRDDVFYVLMNCRNHLIVNPHDVVARVRLGLTLLMLFQEAEALRELQQVFLRSPVWRPFLRLLVNEAKERRGNVSAQVVASR